MSGWRGSAGLAEGHPFCVAGSLALVEAAGAQFFDLDLGNGAMENHRLKPVDDRRAAGL